MRRATLMFVLVLLPSLARAQGSWTHPIDLPRTAQVEPVTPSTELMRSSLSAWLQRADVRNERSRFELSRHSEWLEQSEKREPQPGSQRRNWIGRHPALFGALIGAGVGAVSAVTLENELVCSGGDEDCVFYGGSRALIGAGVGAGVGALVGWIAGLVTK